MINATEKGPRENDGFRMAAKCGCLTLLLIEMDISAFGLLVSLSSVVEASSTNLLKATVMELLLS